jgi:hypothetical protein
MHFTSYIFYFPRICYFSCRMQAIWVLFVTLSTGPTNCLFFFSSSKHFIWCPSLCCRMFCCFYMLKYPVLSPLLQGHFTDNCSLSFGLRNGMHVQCPDNTCCLLITEVTANHLKYNSSSPAGEYGSMVKWQLVTKDQRVWRKNLFCTTLCPLWMQITGIKVVKPTDADENSSSEERSQCQ